MARSRNIFMFLFFPHISVEHDPVYGPRSNRTRIGLDFKNISTGSDMDIQTALIAAVECLIRGFFRYKPNWIK